MLEPRYSLTLGALAGSDDLPVALHGGELLTRATLRHDVTQAIATLAAASAAGPIALFEPDVYRFTVWLLAGWHDRRTVILPGDNTVTSCAALREHANLYIGDLGNGSLTDWRCDPAPLSLAPIPANHVAVEVFTSGSTGAPLRIAKALHQLDAEMAAQQQLFGQRCPPGTPVVGTVSPQHLYGLLFRVLWPLSSGGVLVGDTIAYPEGLWQAAERPAMLISSPAFLKRLPDHLAWPELARHFCAIVSSGGPLPAEASRDATRRLGVSVHEIYGSSETGGIAWRNDPTADWAALPGVAVKVDEEGALYARSPFLPDQDWFACADRAELTTSGFRLLGRADRIAKIEEKRISLTRIEDALRASGWIDDARVTVLEGARAEVGAAVVLNATGRNELATQGEPAFTRTLRTLLAQSIERIGLPRRWRFVTTLPQNAMGKIAAHDIAALFAPQRWPQVITEQTTGNTATLELAIGRELAWFDGHFAGSPVLAGVVQIEWAVHFARKLLTLPPHFAGMDAIKFQHAILPGAVVTLTLECKPERGQLQFVYQKGQYVCASGKLRFNEDRAEGEAGND
ncbi:ApeI family dehydratase [Andreprevotia chitinilytica]|uniref:ApeI family dehydratase n=1 Tax=Andreprevotia chitinilytica TaxID=396808 RepID=UPI00068DF539|nr:AMP-binding protein [Andreprevotia chitinilytica]